MTTVVLVHGWGYDAGLWDAVRARLPAALTAETLDFGYFGATHAVPPAPTFAESVIAVGHSLGALWWLAQSDISWRRLLCLNGFPRFTETDAYSPAVAPRVLARMQAQFARDPVPVLADFHARCGGHAPSGTPDPARLAAGLDGLAHWDGRKTLAARSADVFALAGAADAIVPAAMSAMAFSGSQLECVAAPGHLLPVTHPELCARWIERLAA
ncbi:MAG: hypothetical protein Q8L56_05345 [Rhodocyclaceae bacterium]|nr:hypothetical protein [Rhodocyclaceae bacterium]